MGKTAVRYFFDFAEGQERWLNKMAARGWRLDRFDKLTYRFFRCAPGEYRYCVAFAGGKSAEKHTDYRRFLESLDYHVTPQNINLKWRLGKLRFRPGAEGAWKLAAAPGAFNTEILIVEGRNDGKPFEPRADAEDLAEYLKIVRDSYYWAAMTGASVAAIVSSLSSLVFALSGGEPLKWCGVAALGIFGSVCLYCGINYFLVAKRYRDLTGTNEW